MFLRVINFETIKNEEADVETGNLKLETFIYLFVHKHVKSGPPLRNMSSPS